MSMTRADAKNYIARVLSAVQSQQAQIWAEESLQRTFTDWQLAKNWEFLFKDTSETRVIDCGAYTYTNKRLYAIKDENDVVLPTLVGVNVGQKLYAALLGWGASIGSIGPNDNEIESIKYDESTGYPEYIVLKYTPSSATNNSAAVTSVIFRADIPIIAGQTDYNLPFDFYAPATIRILGDAGYKIEYIRNGTYYRAVAAPDVSGMVDFYSFHNANNTAGKGLIPKLRLRKPPAKNDVIRIEYFRAFDKNSDPLDIPDDYLYKFLDYGRGLILETKRATEDPSAYMAHAMQGLGQVAKSDSEPVDDEEICLLSQMSVFSGDRKLWSNGAYEAEA